MSEAMDLKTHADIEDQVRERFRKVSQGHGGHFSYPTGREGLLALAYDQACLGRLPDAVQEYYCGVGNPFSAGVPQAGESVLDVGCGAGVDALVAAVFVGPQGRVSGLEFSADMIARAQANAEAAGVGNLSFVPGTAESLPFADRTFDLLVSNGVYNLVLRKRQALAEAFRVLRPGGRLQVADQILVDEGFPQRSPQSPAAWAG
jgi:SAM-dependent methyltransferase